MVEPGVAASRTARLEHLSRMHDGEIAKIHAAHVESIIGNAELVAGIRFHRAQLHRAQDRLDLAERRLARLAAEPELAGRRMGEDALPDDLVARRRAREHAARRAGARAKVEQAKTELSEIEKKLAVALERIELDHQLAADRACKVHADCGAAASAYLAGAERTHSQPEALSRSAPELLPALPGWVQNSCQCLEIDRHLAEGRWSRPSDQGVPA